MTGYPTWKSWLEIQRQRAADGYQYGLPAHDVGAMIGKHPNTVYDAVRKLKERGVIEHRPDIHLRAYVIDRQRGTVIKLKAGSRKIMLKRGEQ